ncbi:MAG: cytochrome b/b6 domain-containing protein [Nitrospirae bacterium]|nr:cytochrome b/b6 domain-containing protein [Nitrospirota bacterium]
MSNNAMVRKASSFEIVNHWALAVSFFVLAVSGYAFLFHLEGVGSVFGGFNQMRAVHNWAGVVFAVSLFLTIFHYLPVSLHFTSDDAAWFGKAGGYFSKRAAVPPQDELNAGQKLYYLVVLAAGVVISASGIVIWLRPWAKSGILLSHLLHNISFDLMVIAIPAHIYLATLANPGTFRIMVYGTVPLSWAKKRHAKWVQRMGF